MEDLPLPSDPIAPKQKNQTGVREWLIGLGVPALLCGSGVALMGWISFSFGVVLVYVAFACLWIDWWKLNRTKGRRTTGSIATLVLIAGFSCIVFRPAPLSVSVYVAGTGYSNGQVAGGITWGSGEGDIRVTLLNPTDRDYADMDIILDVGQNQLELPQIMEIAQLSTIPNISFTSQPFPLNHVHLTEFNLKQPMQVQGLGVSRGLSGPNPRYLSGKDAKGNSVEIPIIGNSETPSPSFRIQFDKLPKHTELKLIAAVAITNPPDFNGNLPKQLFAVFQAPSCIKVSGSYKVLNRPIKIDDSCHPLGATRSR